ncbi:MAG TPA: hypothetical protein VIJ18_18180 [Microbacteriaceae bacterium]
MSSARAYADPVGQRAATNAAAVERFAQYVPTHPGATTRNIAGELHLPRHVITTDIVHLIAVGRLRLAVVANNA